MNIFEKLNAARLALQGKNLKASGKNTFASYTYIELADFLPHINVIFAENGLCGVVRFGAEQATLTVYNTEKPGECIDFTTPMSTASLKGCHEVQNLGAVQSYLRRYLYIAALEIVELDALDATTGKTENGNGQNKPASSNGNRSDASMQPLTDAQRRALFATLKECQVAEEIFKAYLLEVYGIDSSTKIVQKELANITKWIKAQVPR